MKRCESKSVKVEFEGSSEVKERGKRHYGLDLLRIVSMFMIVILHSGSHGGLLETSGSINPQSVYFWFLQSMCIVSVNLFVLISGYFLVYEKFRLSKVLKLMIEVCFYSWTIQFVTIITNRGVSLISIENVHALFPVSSQWYWFMSAYIGLYLLSPVLNILIRAMKKRQHLTTIFLLVAMMCLWNDLPSFITNSTLFGVSSGYSLIWFLVLYIIAAYIRKYVDIGKHRYSYAFGLYFLMCSVLTLFWIITTVISNRTGVSFLSAGYYVRYNSFPVLLASVALFICFAKMKIKSFWIKKLIRNTAPLTVGVYLIHDNPVMRDVIWNKIVRPYLFSVNSWLPFAAFGTAFAIFAICCGIDFVRARLFHLIEKRNWYKNAMARVDELPGWITGKICSNDS